MAYSREAHELLEEALQELKTKHKYPWAYFVGMLMPNVPLTEAKRIAKIISEMENQND
jgi:hypothetical protein